MLPAQSRTSTAPVGACGCRCTAGAAPPKRPERKKAIRRSGDRANGQMKARSSGTGAFVVAKSPGDAALDHDRTLRALLAGNDAGHRARGKAVDFLHFGKDWFKGHPHQRGGNLRLLLLVVGDADGGEN